MTQAESKLSLRDFHRILRQPDTLDLVPVAGWQRLMQEIRALIDDRATGLILLHGESGSGKSTFQKILASELSSQGTCHVIRGIAGEGVTQSGWLLNFLGASLAGHPATPLTNREIVLRLNDLAEENNGIAIVLDGIDSIRSEILINDLNSFLNLIIGGNLRILLIAAVTKETASQILSHANPGDARVINRSLPRLDQNELRAVIEKRLAYSSLNSADLEKIRQNVIVSEEYSVGQMISRIINQLSTGAEAVIAQDAKQPALQNIKAKRTTKKPPSSPVEEAPETHNQPKRHFDEFLKPKSKRP